jgi:hypothetical protein
MAKMNYTRADWQRSITQHQRCISAALNDAGLAAGKMHIAECAEDHGEAATQKRVAISNALQQARELVSLLQKIESQASNQEARMNQGV